jgi:5-methyltetrahydrofolate--homocysteine methyltransferase
MSDIESRLRKILDERVVIIDGAMGTMLDKYTLSEADFGGKQYEGCYDYLTLTRPDIIEEIHTLYLEAGADIIETNTLGASPIDLAEYGLAAKTKEINYHAAKIAKNAAKKYSNRFVAGSIGPTTKSIVVTGNIFYEEMKNNYLQQILGLIDGGCDLLFIETSQDTLNLKAAFTAAMNAQAELKKKIPVFLSVSVLESGTMLAGQDIEAFYNSVRHFNPFAIGMNCALGPKEMKKHVQALDQISDLPIFIYPNAGLPNENGKYDETPEEFSTHIESFLDKKWLNIVGGCCGTTIEHIKKIKELSITKEPRKKSLSNIQQKFAVSGTFLVTPDEKIRPILVGERTNVQGSRKFKELIRNQKWDEAIGIAKQQIINGAQIIDISLTDNAYDEIDAIREFYSKLTRAVKVPLMIDSTNPLAIEEALRHSQGKAIINSINLEGGLDKIEKIVNLMKEYGSAAVVGVIDEDGMATTYERKIEISNRLYQILVDKFQVSPEDLIFDMLVLTVDTGKKYSGSAKATIEAVREVKKLYPNITTILGVSNVSFGLPPASREVLNAVFFYHAVQAGLDLAIVNPATLRRYNSLSDEEILLSNNVLFEKTENAVMLFAEYFREKEKSKENHIPAVKDYKNSEEAVYDAIVLGINTHLEEYLKDLLTKQDPLDIIEKHLMRAMDEVGILFGEGKLIITEVLQSAEVMKIAITYLEPLIQTGKAIKKKKILLATVKGDVHDIGKNLVSIIFSSNGYEVIDLGTKVNNQTLLKAIKTHNPDAIGLSGLLVKSAEQMVLVAEDLEQENIKLPIICGGAALTRNFVENKIQNVYSNKVYYAKDVMSGLKIVNEIFKTQN